MYYNIIEETDDMHRHAVNVYGDYIGLPEYAKQLCDEKGINPELAVDTHNTCSIGFCENEQKWYGWSHRAMYGFGVGSEVKFGDCAFSPRDIKEARSAAIEFWNGPSRTINSAMLERDEDGREYFLIEFTRSTDPALIPNEKVRGKIDTVSYYVPETYGNGEWIAETLEDAKQMAKDFAKGVD